MEYRTRGIISRGLYISPHFLKDNFVLLRGLFLKILPYVWLVFKSRLQSRASYNGAYGGIKSTKWT